MAAGMGISGGKKTYDGATDLLSQSILAVEEMESLNTNVAKKSFKVAAQIVLCLRSLSCEVDVMSVYT